MAREPRSDRAAAWRFRVVFALVLLALAVGVFFLYRFVTGGGGEGSPGLNQGLGATAGVRGDLATGPGG